MFREMRRKKQALEPEVCEQILIDEKRGVLAVHGDDGYPYAIPIDFYYDKAGNSIYFHSAREGHKVDSILRDDKVCFTTWNKGEKKPDDWSYFVDSVVVFGRAVVVEDELERLEMTRRLGVKYYPTEEEVDIEIGRAIDRMLLVRIEIEHISGKKVHER